MSENGQPPDADSVGVVRHLRSFLAACAQYASARLRLASIEGKDAAGQAGKVLILAGAALFAGVLGWLLLCFAAVFLLGKAMGEYGWVWAALIMAAFHFAAAALLGFALRSRSGKPFFPLTTAEFQKDRERLEKEKR